MDFLLPDSGLRTGWKDVILYKDSLSQTFVRRPTIILDILELPIPVSPKRPTCS